MRVALELSQRRDVPHPLRRHRTGRAPRRVHRSRHDLRFISLLVLRLAALFSVRDEVLRLHAEEKAAHVVLDEL